MEAVRVVKAPYWEPVGRAPLRGVWGHSPSEIFWNLDTQRCHLMQSEGIWSVKIIFHLHDFIYRHFQLKDQTCVFIDTLFKFRCNEICNKNKIAYNAVFCINLIDTTVNNYITVQEQWKILELTITMCLHCHAHCNCHFSWTSSE